MPKAHIIGQGKSGIAAAKLLHRCDWQVHLSDSKTSEALQTQAQTLVAGGIQVTLGSAFTPAYVESLQAEGLDLVVVSPGVPWDIPGLLRARELGIETIGEMELAWRHLKTVPWVGITGTNGKTTTTALVAAIFQAAGLKAPACGNIGYAACELALAALETPINWVIAELSSYQIEASTTIAPRIGLWTTFTPDHLSRHKTLENYYGIKAHLLKNSCQQVFNGDDPYLCQVGLGQWPDACWTSVAGKDHLLSNPDNGVYVDEQGWVVAMGKAILPVSALRMPGVHNHQNLLMAIAAAILADIPPAAIVQAVEAFPGVPHRLEHIRVWQGIDFINDSKATNYDAAEVGLRAIAGPVILIAGGEAKAGDDTGWLQAIHAKTGAVLLIGNAAASFADRLQQVGYSSYEVVETMERAVQRGAELAKQLNANRVLLSPACASFDQYENFEQRGDHFRQLCLAL